jgi:zinc and cadmium transporter
MSTYTLLISYSSVIILASLMGGWLPSHIRLTHTRTQMMMSFVAGLMLGIAFYHLLPHAISTLPAEYGVDSAMWWLMVGLLFMFVLLRAFHFHQHGTIEDSEPTIDHHDHGHDHCHDHQHAIEPAASSVSGAGIALGLAVHTLIDGVALAAAIQAGVMEESPLGLLGFGVFVAIVLHKPLDAMSISSMMIAGGWSATSRRLVNILFSLMCPLGALLFLLGIQQQGGNNELILGAVLAFAAGVFICISLSDLLPEVQFHSHDRAKLNIALFVGIVAAYGIGLIEPEGAHSAHSDLPDHAQHQSH